MEDFKEIFVPRIDMIFLILSLGSIAVGLLPFLLLKFLFTRRKQKQSLDNPECVSVAFFHPYCNAGGGGEKVLWCAIRSIQKQFSYVHIVVYTGDVDAYPAEILNRAEQRFKISMDPASITFVFLNQRRFVEASTYPHFTLIGQSIGGLCLGFEALWKFVPDVYIDSMGYAFTLPLFRFIGGCRVGCYVHYPTISTDMLTRVSNRTAVYNNPTAVAGSTVLTHAKLIYYWVFAFLYGLVGKASERIAVNSSWTLGHVVHLWNKPSVTKVIYPPCDIDSLAQNSGQPSDGGDQQQHASESLLLKERTVNILSVGQFRPEKDHQRQLEAFARFVKLLKDSVNLEDIRPSLILLGGCRNAEDKARVEALKVSAESLGITDQVEWVLNASFDQLQTQYATALIGLHTMWNEHFGIAVVDSMAAGNIMVAHNSGGPQYDIVISTPKKEERSGYLATTAEEYALCFMKIISLTPVERNNIRSFARTAIQRFSEPWFEEAFTGLFSPLWEDLSKKRQ